MDDAQQPIATAGATDIARGQAGGCVPAGDGAPQEGALAERPDLAAMTAPPAAAEAEAGALKALAAARPSPFRLGGGCRWIEGDARAPDGAVSCGAPREAGRPYCRPHCLRAYRGLQRVSAATETLALAAHSRPLEPEVPGDQGAERDRWSSDPPDDPPPGEQA